MHSTGSYIKQTIEQLRFYLNDEAHEAQFKDDYLVRTVLGDAVHQVMTRINTNSDSILTLRHDFPVAAGVKAYHLPPYIQEVWRLAVVDEAGKEVWDVVPRNRLHPCGPGWSLEATTLVFDPPPVQTRTWRMWYTPGSTLPLHYSDLGGEVVDANTFQLDEGGTTGFLGTYDRRINAYGGAILRLLGNGGTGGGYRHDVVIESFDVTTGRATLRTPLPDIVVTQAEGDTEPVLQRYEVVPIGFASVFMVAALGAAMKAAINRRVSQAFMGTLDMEYRKAMKSARDTLSHMNTRRSATFGVDNSVNYEFEEFGAFDPRFILRE